MLYSLIFPVWWDCAEEDPLLSVDSLLSTIVDGASGGRTLLTLVPFFKCVYCSSAGSAVGRCFLCKFAS